MNTINEENLLTNSNELRSVRSMTCYICLENISQTNKQFGLQNNCDHFFCFDCLITWRRTSSMIDKETAGQCPLCRIRSTFIASSWRCFTTTEDKNLLIERHKQRLKTIPCQHLLRYDYCRFGHRCYYNHNLSSTDSLTTNFPWYRIELNDQQEFIPRRVRFSRQSRYRPY